MRPYILPHVFPQTLAQSVSGEIRSRRAGTEGIPTGELERAEEALRALPAPPPGPIPLYEWEAKTLVLLVPAVQKALREGYPVYVHGGAMAESKYNYEVFYAFRVGLGGDSPSDLLDFYGVNKYTGDVSRLNVDEIQDGPDLRALQDILRQVHRLTDDVLERYRMEQPRR